MRQLRPRTFHQWTFLGTVRPRTDACHWPIMQIVEHSLAASHDGFCQFLLERLAMWPRGHISNRMRSASFGLRLLRRAWSALHFTARSIGFRSQSSAGVGSVHGRSLAYDPARGFLARRRRAWRRHMRCRSLAMAAAIGLALRGTSLAADPPLSRLAMQSDQGAGNLRCRRVGRAADRRRGERLGGRCHDQGFGRPACGAPHVPR